MSKDNLPRLGNITNLDPDSPEEIQLPEDMNDRLRTLSLFIGFNFNLIGKQEESGAGSR